MRSARGSDLARRVCATGMAMALCVVLSACGTSGNTIADQAKRGDDLGYVAGDGAVQQLAPEARRDPITLSGVTLSGSSWDIADQRGSVVVLNVWGSWCQPCEAEAPYLEAAHVELSKRGVQVMGINVGEGPQTGAAAAKRWAMTYPSLSDPDRVLAASLDGLANATPSTVVVDAQGRIAGRISGAVTSASTVIGLVEDATETTLGPQPSGAGSTAALAAAPGEAAGAARTLR